MHRTGVSAEQYGLERGIALQELTLLASIALAYYSKVVSYKVALCFNEEKIPASSRQAPISVSWLSYTHFFIRNWQFLSLTLFFAKKLKIKKLKGLHGSLKELKGFLQLSFLISKIANCAGFRL